MNWLGHLPDTGIDDSLLVHFTDKEKLFQYADEDFCTFRSFPASSRVYPVIETEPDLNCSSTLIWLLQNWRTFQNRLAVEGNFQNSKDDNRS